MPELSLTPELPPRDGLNGPQDASAPAGGAQDARGPENAPERPSGASGSLTGPALRRALAFNAVGPALNERGAWLPLTARQAVADAVLAAIDPALEHCIHDRGIHHRHHRTPVDGCPWCTDAGVRVDEIETGELT